MTENEPTVPELTIADDILNGEYSNAFTLAANVNEAYLTFSHIAPGATGTQQNVAVARIVMSIQGLQRFLELLNNWAEAAKEAESATEGG